MSDMTNLEGLARSRSSLGFGQSGFMGSRASVQARSQLLVAVLGVTVAAAETRSSTEYFVVRQEAED
jgi:hypothetical protein